MLYKYRKFIIVAVMLILISIAWAIYYSVFIFHVSSTTPNVDSVSRYAPVLRIHFNKELADEKVKVTGDIVKSSEVQPKDKTLVVYLNALNLTKNSGYSFTITSISSNDGSVIKDKVISFQTKDIPFGDLSSEDQKVVLDAQQAQKSSLYSDVIFEYLPYSTLSYSIEAREPTSDVPNVKIFITATLSAADVRIDRNGTIQKAYEDARTYLSSLKGVSLQDYDIQYKVIEPSLY